MKCTAQQMEDNYGPGIWVSYLQVTFSCRVQDDPQLLTHFDCAIHIKLGIHKVWDFVLAWFHSQSLNAEGLVKC